MKAVILALILSAAAQADNRWVRLSNARFEIFSDAGPGSAREVLRRFEEMRQVLMALTQAQKWSAHAVRVFVFRNETEFVAYRDARHKLMAGFYRSGPDRDYILMKNTGADLYRVVFHEYVHLVLHHTGVELPLWFNEGTAELFSTVQTTRSEIKVGEIIPQHIQVLRRQAMLPLPELMQVDRDSAAYNEDEKVGMFYAESWAFVHMLNMSDKYAAGLPRFLELLLTGVAQTTALEQVYGRSSDEVFRDLRQYVSNDHFVTRTFPSEPFETPEKVEPTPLTAFESSIGLADLLINVGKPAEAARRLKNLAQQTPRSSRIEEALGDTALSERRQIEALKHYERAIEFGTHNARIYFETAALLRETGGGSGEVIGNLQKAIELNPSYSQARELLASVQFASKREPESSPRIEPRPPPEIPEGWRNRQGNRKIEGKLVQVDCLGKAARFVVVTATGKVALHVGDPSKVVLTDAPGSNTQFACGAVQARDVMVEYIAQPDPAMKTDGEITAIRFR